MASLSATSLDVVRLLRCRDRRRCRTTSSRKRGRAFGKAVELDPKFGIGYQLLAVVSRNLGNLQDAEKYINEALSIWTA